MQSLETETNTNTRKALVTGGGSGIGKAVAALFAERGIKTCIADANPCSSSKCFQTDITSTQDIANLFQELNNQDLLPDILICNAGRGISEKMAEGDPEKWKDILDLNIMGHLRTVRAFLPHMLEQGHGDIVFVSSIGSRNAHEYGGIYNASKAAIQMIAETLRLEVQPKVRVSTVLPGVVDTDFFDNMVGGGQTAKSIGWGALKPEEVADAIAYIISRPQGVAINELTIRPVGQPL